MTSRSVMSLFAGAACLAAACVAHAFDVAPFKPGDGVDTDAAKQLVERYNNRPQQKWVTPRPDEIPSGARGDAIRYGMEILRDTSSHIGPHAPDPALRYSANNLNCVNCHEAGASGMPGTKPFALPFVNVVNDYPKLDIKSMRIISLEDRIAQMCGRGAVPFAHDSKEMKAIVAYMTWLGSKARPGMGMDGTGLETVQMPARAADAHSGEQLFNAKCAACHSSAGTGIRKPDFANGGGYVFPPIAGDDTYDDGGHMYMVPLLTRFVHANMPFGSSAAAPVLSVDEAYDIAAYVNSVLPRKHSMTRVASYPDPLFRPEGFAVPELFGGDAAAYQAARFGPYKTANP